MTAWSMQVNAEVYQADTQYARWREEVRKAYLEDRKKIVQGRREVYDEVREMRKYEKQMERVRIRTYVPGEGY
jgi:hypothetical protein